jgi:hydrogenase-4 component F
LNALMSSLALNDRLALLMAALTLIVGLAGLPLARKIPRGIILHLATLLALLLALLADDPPIAWLGAAIAVLLIVVALRLSGDAAAAWALVVTGGSALALALLGVLLLAMAAPAEVASIRWATLGAVAARSDGQLTSMAFIFSLLGWGALAGLVPMHGALSGQGPGGTRLLRSLLSVVAMVAILRVRSFVAATPNALSPGPSLLGVGLVSVLFASIPSRRLREEAAVVGIGQTGVVAFAFGLGPESATMAGILHLTLLTLIRGALLVGFGRATQVAGLMALAGLPPFGLFASLFLIVTETTREAPLLAIPLVLGLAGCALALTGRIVVIVRSPPRPEPLWLALLPSLALLGLSAWLGFAMPDQLATWLGAIARGLR